MISEFVDQAEQAVQLVRFGPSTNRPHSPPQGLWQGSPPRGVKAVLTRHALADRQYYAKWASNFALLTDEFIAQAFQREESRIKQLERDEWLEFPFFRCLHCKVGDDYLWIQEQAGGWTIELCHPAVDPDARILTIQNMPVLCPDGLSAARLALACYPKPRGNLVWHPYW